MRVEAGVGDRDAPPGTEPWARYLRLHLVSAKHSLRNAPERFATYFRDLLGYRAWTLMHDERGQKFATFDAFCRAPEPWGFGQPWSEIRPFLAGVLSEQEINIVTVAPAETRQKENVRPGVAGPGRGHKKTDGSADDPSVSRGAGRNSEVILRAIAERSDDRVKTLYKTGLLGGEVAAKLGPKNPTPETSERCTRIAIELAEEAKKLDTSTEALKRQAQRALNAKARELLGVRVDKVAAALRAFEALGADERERFLETGRTRGWWQ